MNTMNIIATPAASAGFDGFNRTFGFSAHIRRLPSRAAAALLLALLLGGCAGKQAAPQSDGRSYDTSYGTSRPDRDYSATDAQVAADIAVMPQDLAPYAQAAGADTPVLTAAEQRELAIQARKRLFAPWSMTKSGFKAKDALWGLFSLKPERGFAENLRPYPPERWKALTENAQADAFPNHAVRAITLDRVDLRLLPTDKPYFFNPAKGGEGYPFDYYQNSALPLGTPVFISHASKDGLWLLAESGIATGWVKASDIAPVSEAFMREWKAKPFAAVVREGTPVSKGLNSHRFASLQPGTVKTLPQPSQAMSIGTLLPYEPANSGRERVTLYMPERQKDGYARMARAVVPADVVRPWPLPMTRASMARLGNQMLGQLYGWGCFMGNRDCSALTRDLLVTYGVWLPRNSAAQAKTGSGLDLSKLSVTQKEAAIVKNGVPFLSLIAMPGHIGLYLGEYQGKPVMFHNVWGIRTVVPATDDEPEHDGRAVIGKAVITTLEPGKERRDLATPHSLLDRVNRLTTPGK